MWLRNLCRERAQAQPERMAYSFLGSNGAPAQALSYGSLDRQARGLAEILRTRTREQARVLLVFEPGLDFVVSFFACVYAGRIAVPMAAPRLRGAACDRLRVAWQNSEAEAVLSHRAALARLSWQDLGIPAEACLDLDHVRPALQDDRPLRAEPHSDFAFIQFTSGSTSEPKGVVVTYDSLRDNLRQIRRRFRHHPETRGVGWLPMHHDMGLVGSVLEPMHTGFHAILMSPLDFVQRPARWLQAVQRYQAEVSGGPTFAYQHCVERITDAQREHLDLSSWTLAFVGAEAVRADVLDAFATRFGACGFRRNAFFPCYGMAEATLMISGARDHRGPRTVRCEGDALAQGKLVQSERGERWLIGCGEPVDGHDVRVVDATTGEVCPDGKLGELWVSGPSIAAGYWRATELSAHTFQGRLRGETRPFLRTGDVGFMLDGQVFVCGRLKTQIVIRGMNLAPEDVEAAAQAAAPELVANGGAAFSVDDDGREMLVLVQEIRRECLRMVKLRPLERVVVEAIVRGFGANAEVVFVPPGVVPRTTSGKIQRLKARELYRSGALRTLQLGAPGSAGRSEHVEAVP